MKLQKAIEVLDRYFVRNHEVRWAVLNEAAGLLIEAGKRVRDMRISPCTTADELLPGETEEEEHEHERHENNSRPTA